MPSFNRRYGTSEVWVDPPASENAPGIPGMKAGDGIYKYECYAADRWLRFLATGWTSGAPANTVPPVISGNVVFGGVITCSTGTWTGSPTLYTYAWFVNGIIDSDLGTSNSIEVTEEYSDAAVKCRVTATNVNGSASAFSDEVEFPLAAPVNTVSPVLSGLSEVGETLTVTTGTWTGSPTAYAYAWFVDGVQDPTLGTANSIVVPEELGGTAVRCRVTATNATGSTAAYSNTKNIGSSYTPGLDFSEPQNSMYIPALATF